VLVVFDLLELAMCRSSLICLVLPLLASDECSEFMEKANTWIAW